MDRETVNFEVRALGGLDLEGLRTEWKSRYGRPPRMRSRELLGLMLAWRIQSDAFGGLEAGLKRKLRSPATTIRDTALVSPGVILTREWKGAPQTVTATNEGFDWNGSTYSSLSAVARAITGIRWNGPRFFGLREGA